MTSVLDGKNCHVASAMSISLLAFVLLLIYSDQKDLPDPVQRSIFGKEDGTSDQV